MNIIIGADFVPTESNMGLFEVIDIDALFGKKLNDYLNEAQYRIFNLEVPLTDKETPISKCGPNLIAPTNTIATYSAINVNLLTLANNHIFDQGLQGMLSTCEILNKHKIDYIGVGKDRIESARPHFFSFANKKIGVYACCEHEFGVATEVEAGANSFDPLETLDQIENLRRESDYVILLYHGGKEHYRYPSPLLQKTCRKFVEKGADLVICQHSHCIGCEEKYEGATIVYGQGNFLFDRYQNDYWNTSLLVSINEDMEISYRPLVRKDNAVRLANSTEASKIMDAFNKRSEEIKVNGFVEKQYSEFSNKMIKNYLLVLNGKITFFCKILNKLTHGKLINWLLTKKFDMDINLSIQNYLECEAHRELLIQGIKNFRKVK